MIDPLLDAVDFADARFVDQAPEFCSAAGATDAERAAAKAICHRALLRRRSLAGPVADDAGHAALVDAAFAARSGWWVAQARRSRGGGK